MRGSSNSSATTGRPMQSFVESGSDTEGEAVGTLTPTRSEAGDEPSDHDLSDVETVADSLTSASGEKPARESNGPKRGKQQPRVPTQQSQSRIFEHWGDDTVSVNTGTGKTCSYHGTGVQFVNVSANRNQPSSSRRGRAGRYIPAVSSRSPMNFERSTSGHQPERTIGSTGNKVDGPVEVNNLGNGRVNINTSGTQYNNTGSGQIFVGDVQYFS